MREFVEWEWQFGGFIQPIAGPAAWVVLAAALCVSVIVAWLSYGRSLRALSLRQRLPLVALRALLLLLILGCLANPVRIERSVLDDRAQRRLTVLADRSDSMTTPDREGRTRLQDALGRWSAVTKRAPGFASPDAYAFDRSLSRVGALGDAAASGAKADETALFASLRQLLAEAGDGSTEAIVCLTDGLDTTGEDPAPVIAAARAAQIPLYFVAGRNRLQREPSLKIRNLVVPTVTMPHSEIGVRAVIEAYSESPRTIPLRLLRDGIEVEKATLDLPRGEALVSWEGTLTTGAAGQMPLTLEIGEGPQRVAQRALTTVADRLVTRVLFYQGALDWGFRFFRDALAEDENFEVATLFSPSTGVRLHSGMKTGFTDLPSTAAELTPFNLVVLSNVRHDQFDAAQEQALLSYVRNGGGLLFILPDTAAAGGFVGSTIEAMLPVAFGRPPVLSAEDMQARIFQEQMRGRASNDPEAIFANSMVGKNEVAPLLPFEVLPDTSLAKLFRADGKIVEPRFTHSARVRQVKPGAEILAVSDDGAQRQPLMVAQPFGRGRSTALVSDMLWRWSLSEPSDRQTARNFWQQLTVWLAQPAAGGLRFLDSFGDIAAHTPVTMRLESAEARPPDVVAIAPVGHRTSLPVTRAGDRLWRVDIAPGEPGAWVIEATGGSDAFARMTFDVVNAGRVDEHQVRPPDVARLRAMAEATGGRLLDSDAPPDWKRAPTAAPPVLLSERRTLLWDRWWLFLPMLGIYGAELLLRRRLRLV